MISKNSTPFGYILRALKYFFYPPFCTVCQALLGEDKVLCSACLSQLELSQSLPEKSLGGLEATIFENTAISSTLIKKVQEPSGYFLSQAIAGYAGLRILDLGWDAKAIHVEKGLEGVGKSLSRILGVSFSRRRKTSQEGVLFLKGFYKEDAKLQKSSPKANFIIYFIGQETKDCLKASKSRLNST